MPHVGTVMRWIADNSALREQYARAREMQGEIWAHEIIEISDDAPAATEEVAKAKLRVDTRKWLMSRILPKKYGDRVQNEHTGPDGGPIQHEHSGNIGLGDVLAKHRVEGE